jgi:hypothetical protein
MKKILILVMAITSLTVFGQVGIDTTEPKATLDVTGAPASATTADGVIMPRVTGDQLAAKDAVYLADQTGTQVYVTAAATTPAGKTINVTESGYYYFDGTVWVRLAAAGSGKNYAFLRFSDNQTAESPNDNLESIYRAGKVVIGNVTTNPNLYYGSSGSSSLNGNAMLNIVKDFNLASDYGPSTINYAAQLINFSNAPAGTNPGDLRAFIARQYTAQTSDNITNVYGGSISTSHRGTGTVGTSRGILSTASNISTGTITSALGIVGSADNNSTGTITNATAVSAAIRNNSSGTITNSYGVNVAPQANTGTITNGYGLFINDILATNGWGVYQQGANDKNYFAGHTAVGNHVNNPDDLSLIHGVTTQAKNVLNIQEKMSEAYPAGYISRRGISSTMVYEGTGTSGGFFVGMGSDMRIGAASTANYTGQVQGITNDLGHLGSGTVANLSAFSVAVSNGVGAGAINNAHGLRFTSISAAGTTINNVYDVFASGNINGNVTNSYGYYKVSNGGSGVITNGYGIYLENIRATNGWGIYQAGTDDRNYLAGRVSIGTTSSTSPLQVAGLPVHANNVAAITAGLTVGAFYHAGDGIVRVVF